MAFSIIPSVTVDITDFGTIMVILYTISSVLITFLGIFGIYSAFFRKRLNIKILIMIYVVTIIFEIVLGLSLNSQLGSYPQQIKEAYPNIDSGGLFQIQNTLKCCGFNAPNDTLAVPTTCEKDTKRSTPCKEPYTNLLVAAFYSIMLNVLISVILQILTVSLKIVAYNMWF